MTGGVAPALQTGGGLGVGGLGAVRTVLRLLAFAAAAVAASAAVAVLYRWYTRRRVPLGPTLLFGVAVVAVYLNTVGLYGDLLTGTDTSLFTPAVILFNVLSLAVGGAGAAVGRSVGDRVATDTFAALGARELDAEVSRVVRTVGRVTGVRLPEEVDDMEGYDPIRPESRPNSSARRCSFPGA
ncbi:MAG: hypothetical protein ABEJ34_08460 [Haloferacaceae archaeon]